MRLLKPSAVALLIGWRNQNARRTEFRKKFGPRGVLDCKATNRDDPTVDPRFGKIGKQTIKDTGPLTKKRMVTIDDDIARRSAAYIKRQAKAGKPFFLWVNFKEGKPVGINKFIGHRPIFAAGNSDGDYQMLRYTTSGKGPRFGLLVHHTDAKREYAYDRKSHIGHLDKALTEAPKRGWSVVDMKRDWKRVFSIGSRSD